MTFKFSSPLGKGYCDEKCQTATAPECQCSCGGTNHGVALSQGNQSNKKNNFINRINQLVKEGYTIQPPLLPNSVLITKGRKKLTKEQQEFRLYQYYKKYGSPFLEKDKGDLADMARDRAAEEKASELQRAIENGTVCCECEHNLEEGSSTCFNCNSQDVNDLPW